MMIDHIIGGEKMRKMVKKRRNRKNPSRLSANQPTIADWLIALGTIALVVIEILDRLNII
jgi:hypothetical protein